jgi:HK97 gp10 family phage protein
MANTANTTVKFVGFKELKYVFQELSDNFGPKDNQAILKKSVRQAMLPVLAQAIALVPRDTGALAASLRVESRRPTGKDKRSKYISETDTVIGLVTTAPGKKLAKTKFTNIKTGEKQVGIKSDMRAAAVEFGTKKMVGTPFLRPALEGEAGIVLNQLSGLIKQNLDKFKSKKI